MMNPTLLRLAIGGNALFSAFCGLILVSTTEPAAAVIGDINPWVLRLLGIGLLLFAAFLFWNVWRPTPHPVFALLITGADVGWVAGSAVLMLIPSTPMSASGTGVVAGIAGVVLVFALLQVAGLRALTRNRRGKTTARSAFSITQRVDAPPDAVWNLVRDLERIGEFSPSIQSVEVRGNQGGARRTCEDRRGQRWSEDVIKLDDQARMLTLRFDTEAHDFPLPLDEMYGGWTIESAGDCADVTVWYEYTMRGGLLGEIVAPLIAHQIRDMMTTTISNIEAESKRMDGIMAGA